MRINYTFKTPAWSFLYGNTRWVSAVFMAEITKHLWIRIEFRRPE